MERKIIGTIEAECDLCDYKGKVYLINNSEDKKLLRRCNKCTPKELKSKGVSCMYPDDWCLYCGDCSK